VTKPQAPTTPYGVPPSASLFLGRDNPPQKNPAYINILNNLEKQYRCCYILGSPRVIIESIQNITLADIYRRDKEIQTARDMIKSMNLVNRKYAHMGEGLSYQQAEWLSDIIQSVH
jgi:hypothetical protein